MTTQRTLALILALAACTPNMPRRTAPGPTLDRVAAECALLSVAAQQMQDAGTPPHAGLREGCPGDDARDTRPLATQSASLRAANAAPLPDGVLAGSRAETVFRRMITRGVPVSIARTLTQTPEFAALTR